MFKKSLFISLVLFGPVVSTIAGEYFAGQYFADEAEALIQLHQAEAAFKELVASFPQFAQAEAYEKDGNHRGAEAIYKMIVADYPGSDYALQARKKLTMLHITQGRAQEADTAFEELVANFSTHPLIPATVYNIAEHATKLEKHERANQLYQYFLDTWPQQCCEMWAQRGVAVSNIALGNMKAAQAATDRLLADFYSNDHIADAVYDIAKECRESEKYEKAKQLYQQVVDNWHGESIAMWSQSGLALCNIALGNMEAAQSATDRLIANYQFTNHIDEAVYDVANQYNRCGKYEKAIEYCQKVVSDWPDYKYAWSAQYVIASCYESLRDSGSLSESEANPEIEQAYQAVIEKYPDCSLVGYAHLKLARLHFDTEHWADAAAHFELFLQEGPDDPRVRGVLYDLGKAYEKMGELELAVEVYGRLIEMIDPSSPLVKELQARIEQLGGQVK